MKDFFRENFVFMVYGWTLGESYTITTWQFWIVLILFVFATEIRDNFLKTKIG